MRKLFIILGFISALTSVVIAVTSLHRFTLTPIIIGFVSGIVVLLLSKKEKTKTIQYIFLLIIIALSLTIYKEVKPKNDIDTQKIKQLDAEGSEEANEIIKEDKTKKVI